MQSPMRITYRNLKSSPSMEARIHDEAAKLGRLRARITSCHVTVEAPHHKGGLFSVRISLAMPGEELYVSHEGPKNEAHQDVYVAIRDAFEAAARRLDEVAQVRRRQVRNFFATA